MVKGYGRWVEGLTRRRNSMREDDLGEKVDVI
jgi:hypothetical protein